MERSLAACSLQGLECMDVWVERGKDIDVGEKYLFDDWEGMSCGGYTISQSCEG